MLKLILYYCYFYICVILFHIRCCCTLQALYSFPFLHVLARPWYVHVDCGRIDFMVKLMIKPTIRDCRDIAYPSPNFYSGGGQKCEIWHRFQHRSILSGLLLKTQHDIWSLKQTDKSAMIALCPLQVWCSSVHEPLRSVRGFVPLWKIWRRNVLNRE